MSNFKFGRVDMRKSTTIGYRYSNGTTDKNRDGDIVPPNYVVFFNVKDCNIIEREGIRYYQPETAEKIIPVNHGGTYYGYGEWKRKRTSELIWMNVSDNTQMRMSGEYFESKIYMVKCGKVYVGTQRRSVEYHNLCTGNKEEILGSISK